jgi:hypothetical protein
MTDQQKQETKAELKAILLELTAGDTTNGTKVGAELDELEQGTTALEKNLEAAQTEIETIVEESGKQLDALIAQEQQEA